MFRYIIVRIMIKVGLIMLGVACISVFGLACSIPYLMTIYENPPAWAWIFVLSAGLVGVVGTFVGFIGMLLE